MKRKSGQGMEDFLTKKDPSLDDLKKKYFEEEPQKLYDSKPVEHQFRQQQDLEEYLRL